MENKIKNFIINNNLIEEEPIICATSGGVDSVCLINILHNLGYKVVLAHVNHLKRKESELEEEAIHLVGLKKFLKEFSEMHKKQPIEVNLWEYYLMYAQIFGIAKKVAKEFKNLYPDVITDEYYNDIIFIHTISYQGVSAASAAKSRAESYSAGGGGFSSGGGGGGSFGGGGGMGGR